MVPGILNESCDKPSHKGGCELASDRVEQMSGNLDQVPQPGFTFGVGEVANLGKIKCDASFLNAFMSQKIR